jgi:hypothetical protein
MQTCHIPPFGHPPKPESPHSPFLSTKNAPKESENCSAPGAPWAPQLAHGGVGRALGRFSEALARSIFKVKMKNKDIRGDGVGGGGNSA